MRIQPKKGIHKEKEVLFWVYNSHFMSFLFLYFVVHSFSFRFLHCFFLIHFLSFSQEYQHTIPNQDKDKVRNGALERKEMMGNDFGKNRNTKKRQKLNGFMFQSPAERDSLVNDSPAVGGWQLPALGQGS